MIITFCGHSSYSGNIQEEEKILTLLEKISNGEDDKNALLIATAENLYMELLGRDRERISDAISYFEASIATGKKSKIEEARKRLEAIIDTY